MKTVTEIKYLEAIKNKYNMFSSFLVSDKTKKYYTQNGLIEEIKEDNKNNKWYFEFKNSPHRHEINLDFNQKLSNHMIMFINYKIFDNNFHFLGATGVAIKISYINDLLKSFRTKHKFIVTFFDNNGNIVLSEKDSRINKNINDIKELKQYKDLIISKKSNLIEYKQNRQNYIVTTKYIPEINLYLSVEANLNDFIKDVQKVFYINFAISILITIIIGFLIYFIIKNYSSKLEYLSNNDVLTKIPNRRDFEEKLSHKMLLQKRKEGSISLIFLDIDNFKSINDTLGHKKGDKVLQEIGNILKHNTRKTDFIARW